MLARLQLGGMAALARATNAVTLREIWNLPETARLRSLALDKLAVAFTESLAGTRQTDHTTGLAASLRPLLDTLLANESRLEIVRHGHGTPVWTFATRLAEQDPSGWSAAWASLGDLLNSQTNSRVSFGSIVTNGWFAGICKTGTNTIPELTSPLWRSVRTGSAPAGDAWIHVEINTPALREAFPSLTGLPSLPLHLDVIPRSDSLRTEVKLALPTAVNRDFKPWRFPTNTIRDPLISFTAVRGVGSWLARQDWFKEAGPEETPDQFCTWGQANTPFQIQFAFPVTDGAIAIARLGETWLPKINPRLAGAPLEPPVWHTTNQAITTRLFFLIPYLRATDRDPAFVTGGIFPVTPGTNAPPPELFEQLERPELAYYDWEITEARLEQLGQTLEQFNPVLTLPRAAADSASRSWLAAIQPHLGNTITELTFPSVTEARLVRNSHIGLNALELTSLAHWIESTNFPAIDLSVRFRPAPKVEGKTKPALPPP